MEEKKFKYFDRLTRAPSKSPVWWITFQSLLYSSFILKLLWPRGTSKLRIRTFKSIFLAYKRIACSSQKSRFLVAHSLFSSSKHPKMLVIMNFEDTENQHPSFWQWKWLLCCSLKLCFLRERNKNNLLFSCSHITATYRKTGCSSKGQNIIFGLLYRSQDWQGESISVCLFEPKARGSLSLSLSWVCVISYEKRQKVEVNVCSIQEETGFH